VHSDYNLSPLSRVFNPLSTMDLDCISPHHGIHPQLAPGAWVHPRATVIGEVALGADASVWPGAVIRGDVNSIVIGDATNIQDGCMCRTKPRPIRRAGRSSSVRASLSAMP
jgi:carbonic anhydrase/acetyltransferase-like protein (isoleucine patch superfamily)